MDEKPNNIQDIDVNSPDFYEKVQNEIEFDMARMKKNVEVILNLRMEAAEIEVETAALFHAELWYDLLDNYSDIEDHSEDEDTEAEGEVDDDDKEEDEEDENEEQQDVVLQAI